MIDFVAESEKIFDSVVAYRREIHQHPELGKQEFRTSEMVATFLEKLGIQVQRNVGAPYPGVVGTLHGGKPGRTVALRADMDALPIQEVRESSYRSQNDGVMHACGHDAHTAIAMGTAAILAAHRDELCGTVKFIFQPNEEVEGGACVMIRDGALDGVDAIFGLHTDPEYPTGKIVLGYDAVMAASDWLNVDLYGKGTHGAYPHRGVDAITMSAEFLSTVQLLVSRELNPLDSAVITFGAIHGGKARNVVCDHVRLEGVLRTLKPDVREQVIGRVREVAEKIADTCGGTAKFERKPSHMATINNAEMVDFAKETALKVFGPGQSVKLPESRLGVEDFGFYLKEVPGVFYFLGTGNTEKETTYPWHSPMYEIDEDAMLTGVAFQSALAYCYLKEFSKTESPQ